MMGTNYYLEGLVQVPCEKCGRPYEQERKHIGKSSAGWVFALHVYPDQGIKDLPDWYDLWGKLGVRIRDSYGGVLTRVEMLDQVLGRFGARHRNKESELWFMQNGAEPGPYGLARAKLGPRVIGHGLGTYSLHIGSEDSW